MDLNIYQICGSDEYANYTVTIEYLTESGDIIYSPYVATLPAGSELSEKVKSPVRVGYKAVLQDTEEDASIVEINIEDIQADVTITVIYEPQETTYLVKRYIQNIYDDNYILYSSEIKTGIADAEIDSTEIDMEIEGFTQLAYDSRNSCSRW